MGDGGVILDVILKLLLYVCALGSAGIALSIVGNVIEAARQTAWLRGAVFLAFGSLIVAGARVLYGGYQLGDLSLVVMVWEAQRACVFAIIGACLALSVACFARDLARSALCLIGAGALAASFGLTGHTQALSEPSFWPFVVAAHVSVASFWAVAPAILWPRAALSDNVVRVRVERFGQIALLVIPLIFISGIALALTIAGGLPKLVASPYGLIIAIKLLAACAALGLGALNKLYVSKTLVSSPERGRTLLVWTLSADIILFGTVIVAISLATTSFGPPS
jgi:copper resistance protein D